MKSSISKIKKQFKIDNEANLIISDFYEAYFKKDVNDDTKRNLFSNKFNYNTFSDEIKEYIMKICKSSLSGSIGTKLFELKFNNELHRNEEFINFLNNKNIDERIEKFQNLFSEHFEYDNDVNFFIIRGKVKSPSTIEGAPTYIQFIMGVVNNIGKSEKTFTIDVKKHKFDVEQLIGGAINANPVRSFFYPYINKEEVDFNKIIYYTSKSNATVNRFVTNVLGCSKTFTGEEEGAIFEEALKSVLGSKISPKEVALIYSKIEEFAVEDGSSKISSQDLCRILSELGYDNSDNFSDTVCELTNLKNIQLNIDNIKPVKKVTIKNEDISINVNVSNLDEIKQVRDEHGNKCLMIHVHDDVEISGFTIKEE